MSCSAASCGETLHVMVCPVASLAVAECLSNGTVICSVIAQALCMQICEQHV